MNGWDKLTDYLMAKDFTPAQWEAAKAIIYTVAVMTLEDGEVTA